MGMMSCEEKQKSSLPWRAGGKELKLLREDCNSELAIGEEGEEVPQWPNPVFLFPSIWGDGLGGAGIHLAEFRN